MQKEILTYDSSECTRRGIIIRYIENKNQISLYKIKFKKDKNETLDKYYYYTKENLLSDEIEQIKEIIKILNENYPLKEEDSFLLLEINIPLFDDLELDLEIKNNICLIDFPGHNTNDNLFFDKKIYQNVIKMSTFFIYMNNGKAFKEDSNKLLLSKLFKEVISIRIGDISPKEFIDSCLFIFNKADTLEKEEKNLDGIQNEVKEILVLPKELDSKISCSLFSSKIYNEFIKYKLENFNSLLEKNYKKFKQQQKNGNFLDYFLKYLNKKVKSEILDFSNNDNDQEEIISFDIFMRINLKVENFFSEKFLIKDKNYENNILKISRLLIYYNENIKKSNYYKECYATETFNIMEENIIKASNLKRNEYINHLERCFYFLNILFRVENILINATAKEDLNSASKNVRDNIKNIFQQFKYENIINQYKKSIIEYLEEQKKNFKSLIKEYNDDIEKLLKSIDDQIKMMIDELKYILKENFELAKKEIYKELEKFGIFEKKSTNSNVESSLGQKVMIGVIAFPCGLIALPFALAYGLLWKLPSLLFKSVKYYFKQKEKIFNDYLKSMKEEINNKMKIEINYYKKQIRKFENLINDFIKIFLGLIEASYVQEDDNYNEARKNYLEIYEDYKKIKNLK